MKLLRPTAPLLALAALTAARADVLPSRLFSDHAVLQQGRPIPVWGTAAEGERVTVAIAGQSAAANAAGGRWRVELAPLPAGGPYTMTIAGEHNRVVVSDILVGEVWVCSGQSNMERQLGPREGQKPIVDWEPEVAAARYPEIRQFYVPQKTALQPAADTAGSWTVCSPETVANFTAVGYFFGRDLFQARHVPVGLIHSSWGGTPAEAWTSLDGLRSLPDFAAQAAEVERAADEIKTGTYDYSRKLAAWFAATDIGSQPQPPWSSPGCDTRGWASMNLPALWEKAGLPDFDGVVWFRKTVELAPAWVGGDLSLELGPIDDQDTTWFNGVQVGETNGYKIPRAYRVPAALVRPGANVITVRVLDTGGGGGLWGEPGSLALKSLQPGGPAPIDLDGPWQWKVSVAFTSAVRSPLDVGSSPGVPGVLFNGMIAPLVPYPIRGVIWYQGEANVGRERQYRTLFPALIADWRRLWQEGDFPFLFVQIAPFREETPEIREAQLLTWQRTRNTAMAVTIDCGDAEDIHPAHKQPVGARLALAARALAYGETIEYSGPVFATASFAGRRGVLRFSHLGGGLVAKGGALTGFTIAGADKVFHPATAVIDGDTVVVSADAVRRPVAARYAWANVPAGNLFNAAGLPASPFRTDVD